MIKVTLDANCIINLLDYKSESATSVEEISEIVRYGLEGDVNIAITTRVESDVNKDKEEERKSELLRRISMFPLVGTVVRLDVTKLGGGDVLGGVDTQELEKELVSIIFPGLNEKDARYSNKINDIDHLIGHKINKRDIFITDDAQIIKKAETLKSSLEITVMSPQKALEYINLQADKLVLIQEFYERYGEFKKIVTKAITGQHISKEDLESYEELRKWLIRKYSVVKDGLINYKFNMSSIPVTGSNRVYGQDDIMSLQLFNDRLAAIFKERNPIEVQESASASRFNYGYIGDHDKKRIALDFLNNVEDTLLGYLGKLESK